MLVLTTSLLSLSLSRLQAAAPLTTAACARLEAVARDNRAAPGMEEAVALKAQPLFVANIYRDIHLWSSDENCVQYNR